jgi:hypothetical protein
LVTEQKISTSDNLINGQKRFLRALVA